MLDGFALRVSAVSAPVVHVRLGVGLERLRERKAATLALPAPAVVACAYHASCWYANRQRTVFLVECGAPRKACSASAHACCLLGASWILSLPCKLVTEGLKFDVFCGGEYPNGTSTCCCLTAIHLQMERLMSS